MAKESPVYRVKPMELCVNKQGEKKWLQHRSEIIRLSLQHDNHFAPEVAKYAIPKDAYQHILYLYPTLSGKIAAFCVVLETYLETEMLWAAPDRNLFKAPFFLAEVFRKIEKDYFATNSSTHMITAKVATPDSSYKESAIGGDGWVRTNRFHEHMGYKLLYPLDHYWENGDHAILMVKYRENSYHGYDRTPETLTAKTKKSEKTERNPQNHTIQEAILENIGPYLRQLERDANWHHRVPNGAPQNLPPFQGFFGVGFFPRSSRNAALFIDFSNDIAPKKEALPQKIPHEYAIEASALTTLLADNSIPKTGVIHYLPEFDRYSEISVSDTFRTLLPDVDISEGFSLFYHRYEGESSHATLYAVSPAQKDVVRQRRNWINFAPDTFPLLWGIHDTLKVLEETHIKFAPYIKELRQCLPVSNELKLQMAKNDQRLLLQKFNFMQAANAHDLRSALQKGAIAPLARGIDFIEEGNIESGLKSIETAADTIENFCDNLSFTIDSFRATLEEDSESKKTIINSELIDYWQNSRQDPLFLKKLNILDPSTIEFRIDTEPMILKIHQKTLAGIFHILINNALDATKNKSEKIQISFEKMGDHDAPYCNITIWNSGSHFPPDVLRLAGERPLTGTIKEGRSGMGLHVVENILRMTEARHTTQQRCFTLNNTKAPYGASVSFSINMYTTKGNNS